MSSFRLILSLVVVVLLAVFVGAPFYFTPPTVQGSVSDTPSTVEPASAVPSTRSLSKTATAPARLTPNVILVQPVIFPVNNQGQLVGHVRAQQGVTVELLADNGAEVVVRLVNSCVRIPRTAVAPTELLPDNDAPSLADNARTAGQRILDYWFAGNADKIVVSAP